MDKLPAVAMAMSGFSGANSSRLWIETCKEMQAVLSSGYLQMAFAFLIACADDKKLSEGLPERFEELLFNKVICFFLMLLIIMQLPLLLLKDFKKVFK